MTRIKGYYTMEELANEMDIHYSGALALSKWLDFRKLGKLYLISQEELSALIEALGDLRILLDKIRENE